MTIPPLQCLEESLSCCEIRLRQSELSSSRRSAESAAAEGEMEGRRARAEEEAREAVGRAERAEREVHKEK